MHFHKRKGGREEEPHDQMSDAPGGTIALLTTCVSLPVLE